MDGRKVMQHLKNCGLAGQSLGFLAVNYLYDVTPQEFSSTLRSLEKDGYIKVHGKKTLDDLEVLIADKASVLVTLEQQKTAKISGDFNLYRLFNSDSFNDDGGFGFFNTQVRLTLRGRLALATGKSITITPREQPDIPQKTRKEAGANPPAP